MTQINLTDPYEWDETDEPDRPPGRGGRRAREASPRGRHARVAERVNAEPIHATTGDEFPLIGNRRVQLPRRGPDVIRPEETDDNGKDAADMSGFDSHTWPTIWGVVSLLGLSIFVASIAWGRYDLLLPSAVVAFAFGFMSAAGFYVRHKVRRATSSTEDADTE